MSTCALCALPDAVDLVRVSGLDFCQRCRSADPTECLADRGIAMEWHTVMFRYNAGLGIPGVPSGFTLSCVPETFAYKVLKLAVSEVEVGDPLFDRAVFVRTNDPERAARLLAREGLQSALLTLLTGNRPNELASTHVSIEGPSVEVSCRPIDGLTPDRLQQIQLETAAMALHMLDLNKPAA